MTVEAVEAALLSRGDAERLVADVSQAARRLRAALALARSTARDVAPTVELEVERLTREASPPSGDRRVVGVEAGRAAEALDGLLRALADAERARAAGVAALDARRALRAEASRSLDLAAVDSAEALGEAVRQLQLPLADLGAALDDAARVRPAVAASLVRRLRAALDAAVRTRAEEVAARLRRLEEAARAVHAAALGPDPVSERAAALLAAADPAAPPPPRVRWPAWSSAQSKQAKGDWRGDPFAPPTVEP